MWSRKLRSGIRLSIPTQILQSFQGLWRPLLPVIAFLLTYSFLPSVAAQTCGATGVAVQVLGSGGPELQDKRASSSYLVWEDARAKALVDAGGGSALRFGESGAQMSQLEVIFFSHFHVDHSGDFSALIKSSWFEDRKNARAQRGGGLYANRCIS